ncbi:hypothetical protein ACLKA6_006761 [Drosophila palustris]
MKVLIIIFALLGLLVSQLEALPAPHIIGVGIPLPISVGVPFYGSSYYGSPSPYYHHHHHHYSPYDDYHHHHDYHHHGYW